MLDGQVVETITAFLFHRGGHADTVRLEANAGKSFVGSYVLDMGFTFDATDKKGVALPPAEMRRLVEANPRNREIVFPCIGGEGVNTSPTHAQLHQSDNIYQLSLRLGISDKAACWALVTSDVLTRAEAGRLQAEPSKIGNAPWLLQN